MDFLLAIGLPAAFTILLGYVIFTYKGGSEVADGKNANSKVTNPYQVTTNDTINYLTCTAAVLAISPAVLERYRLQLQGDVDAGDLVEANFVSISEQAAEILAKGKHEVNDW